MNITTTTELDTLALFDAVLDMVLDAGCINYWGGLDSAHSNFFTIYEDEPDEKDMTPFYRITPADLGQALEDLIALGSGVDPDIRDSALVAAGGDMGEVDATLADVLVQVACFDDIRYG